MTSPKAGIVLGPWYKTEFYGNAGYGLHSNDIRGATITVDPIDKVTPQDRVPLLVRSKGAEIGIRTKAIEGLTSSLAVFVLDFDSELLFVGDAGTTEAEPAQPARRRRMDQPVSNTAVDEVRSRCRLYPRPLHRFRSCRRFHSGCAGMGGGRRRDVRRRERLVRRVTWALFRAASPDRGRQRPFAASLIFNARAGYKFDNGLRLQLDVLNLFNAKTNQIEYYYLSRLPGEPIGGVADRHVHPAEPLAVRLTLAGKF